MSIALHGLRTVIYPSPDLDAAKAWWSALLGVEPYFDEPFYVGYEVGGYELGLLPNGDPANGALTYWASTTLPRQSRPRSPRVPPCTFPHRRSARAS